MKKFPIYSFILLAFLIIANIACSKSSDPAVAAGNCNDLVNTYSAAVSAYASDPTNKTKCQAVLTAANGVLNCSFVTAADKKQVQDIINSNPCK